MQRAEGIPNFILKGWMPDTPFIDRDMNIVAFGSCFASNIGRYLANIGFNIATRRKGIAYVQRIQEGLVNVFAILQQFEWAWEGRTPTVELWHGWKAEEFGYDPAVREATKILFDEAEVFILTFGLSEIWYDEPTGEVFWRAVPADKYDPARHKFRLASYEETLTCLRRIRDLIRKHRPEAAIVITLSPIALSATFRPISCITASTASKAILRAAIDALYREIQADDSKFFYFPSYEVVTSGFFCPFEEDLRHVSAHVLHATMAAFERYFCLTGLSDRELIAVLSTALEVDDLMQGADLAQREALRLAHDSWDGLVGPTAPRPVMVERAVRREKFLAARQARIDERRAFREQSRLATERRKQAELEKALTGKNQTEVTLRKKARELRNQKRKAVRRSSRSESWM